MLAVRCIIMRGKPRFDSEIVKTIATLAAGYADIIAKFKFKWRYESCLSELTHNYLFFIFIKYFACKYYYLFN